MCLLAAAAFSQLSAHMCARRARLTPTPAPATAVPQAQKRRMQCSAPPGWPPRQMLLPAPSAARSAQPPAQQARTPSALRSPAGQTHTRGQHRQIRAGSTGTDTRGQCRQIRRDSTGRHTRAVQTETHGQYRQHGTAVSLQHCPCVPACQQLPAAVLHHSSSKHASLPLCICCAVAGGVSYTQPLKAMDPCHTLLRPWYTLPRKP